MRLNPEEHQEFIVRAGEPAKEMLEEYYETDANGELIGLFAQLSNGPQGGIAQLIRSFVLAFRKNAWKEMLNEDKHSDLRMRFMRANLENEDAKNPIKHEPLDIDSIMKNFASQ